jgi:hypothetical protein
MKKEFSHGDRKDHDDFQKAGTDSGSIQIRIFFVIFATSVWNLLVDAAGGSTSNNTYHSRT